MKVATQKPHRNAKLTVEQVLAIRAEYAKGTTVDALAKKYAVGRTTVQFIAQRFTWRWLP